MQTSNGTITKQRLTEYKAEVVHSAVSVPLSDNYRMETFAGTTPGPRLAFAVSFMGLFHKSDSDQSWKEAWKEVCDIIQIGLI